VDIPKIKYSGRIKEISVAGGAVTVGGETSYPFHLFEGEMPHRPMIAMEVFDSPQDEWPQACLEPFTDVMRSPSAWAKKCVEKFGAEMICLQLAGADPNGLNRAAGELIPAVKEVAASVNVPVIVWGCENDDKDAEVLPKVAESIQDKKIIIGPATDKNYKKVGAACIAYGHTVVASTPIDINLAKQLNILLGDLGVPDSQIIIDLNIGGCTIGYGLEYTYSVMERQKQAALSQQDEKLQFPVLCNFARDVWKKREITLDDEKLGDKKKRGILFEAMTGCILAIAGADILVMRHPEAVRLLKNMINNLTK